MRMASAMASSLTSTKRAAPAQMISTASALGSRVAIPSAKVCAEGLLSARPAANDRQVAGAKTALVTSGGFFFNAQGLILRAA